MGSSTDGIVSLFPKKLSRLKLKENLFSVFLKGLQEMKPWTSRVLVDVKPDDNRRLADR